MLKTNFDFREGLDLSKQVYKNNSCCNCKEFWAYIGMILLAWTLLGSFAAITCASWNYDNVTTFWVQLGIWLAAVIIYLAFFAIPNLMEFYKIDAERKRKKKEEKEALDRLMFGEDADTISGQAETNKMKENEEPK